MSLRNACLTGALTVTPLLSAHAQAVRGTAVDEDSVPVSGVIVLLIDGAGRVTSRALTNDAGEFRVAGDAPGAYRLRTLRIGFRPIVSAPVMLASGEEVSRRIVLTGVPFSLDTVRVVGRSMCQLTPNSDTLTYGIWEQVRAALSAAQVTSRTRGFMATLVTYDRSTDPAGKRVRRESATIKSGFTTRPWYSLPADSLRSVGYVVNDRTGVRTYYAPDLDVLLSDVFLDDHCFQLRESGDPARIGIAFEPAGERNAVAEIKGTVWLDRRSAELRAMDFEYVHYTRERDEGRAGGEMEFARMRNNAWAISRWNIRMPAVTQRFQENSGVPGMPSTPQYRVTEVKVTGGELVLVTRGSDTLLAGVPLVLSGIIEDSVSGRVIAGGRVLLRGTRLAATSDAAGRFQLSPVLPGQHVIEVRTPSLDSIASPHVAPVTFTIAAETHRVRIPPVDTVASRLCSSWVGSGQRPLGLLVGTLAIRGDSVPPANVNVGAQWTDLMARNEGPTAVLVSKTPRLVEARTDSTGTFRLCGVPVNTPLDVRSELNGATLAHDVVIAAGTRWARVRLVAEPRR